jgi:type I phosphodiesterase/nucleotide pyrophosphatase
MRSRMRAGMALMGALAAMAAGAPVAGASDADCRAYGCVLLVEVDGLEPGDVTREGTPFMWALAHPNPQNAQDASGQLAGALLDERNGFMWQAARSPMTAGTAPAAASLLTGANPDRHGVLADEYLDTTTDPLEPTLRRLRPERDQGGGAAEPIEGTAASTLLQLVASESANPLVAAFLGDPALKPLLGEDLSFAEQQWVPDATSGSDPSLCPVPRTAPTVGSSTPGDAGATLQRDCPARDGVTLAQAFSKLSATTRTPALTYIHLAEVGRTKQLDGEPEAQQVLAHTDAELAAFVEGISQHVNTRAGWAKTLVVVTGNHGYEPTPVTQRVPHPTDAGKDFADYVAGLSEGETHAKFVGQGTIGTVYWPEGTPEQLEAMAEAIEESCTCIEEVVPTATLADLHSTWYLDPLDTDGARTGAGGQLLVTTKAGWAFGRVVPGEQPADDDPEAVPDAGEATNPYAASDGGPRNRAIALIMNGPKSGPRTVRQVEGDAMAVKGGSESPEACHGGAGATAAVANAPETMADDSAAPGHECQPETVDVAMSLAAMLKVSLGAQQAPQARFLNEAFVPKLGEEEQAPVVQEEIHEEPPPPDPPPVIIRSSSVQVIPPPPFVDPFPFRGLVRRIRVRVTDANGRPFAKARRGARMSTIEVRADFGKPESLVTLTFYRRAAGTGRRSRLKSIARFKPFAVKRGPVRLRLKIPPQFHPTHLGLLVQEVKSEGPRVKRPVGKPGGGIAAIAGAGRLHARKAGR